MDDVPDPVEQAEDILAKEYADMQSQSVIQDAHLLLATALVEDTKPLAFFLANISKGGSLYLASAVCSTVWLAQNSAVRLLTSENSVKGVTLTSTHDDETTGAYLIAHNLVNKILQGREGMRVAISDLESVIRDSQAQEHGPVVVHMTQIAGDLLTQAFEVVEDFFKEG